MPLSTNTTRLLPLDALRGLIIVLMALDHARLFIALDHPAEFWGVALPQYQDALPFITRLITHLSAPGFFFLMGAGMMLFAEARRQSGWSAAEISRYFAVRGALLIVLQLVLENPAWWLGEANQAINTYGVRPPGGNGNEPWLYFGVLYGLGATLLVYSLLWYRGTAVLILVSSSAILATQFLTLSPAYAAVQYDPWLRLLLIPGQTGIWLVNYPVIPWLGVTGLGLVFGKALVRDPDRAYGGALLAGAMALGFFLVLRGIGGFGNIHPVAEGGWIAFLNMTKYPPSLVFLLFTLGVDLLLLALLAKLGMGFTQSIEPLLVFGRTALFFYITHLYVYALIGLAIPGSTPIALMYPLWLFGLVLLYPLCRWYEGFKQRTPPRSIWRLF